MTLGLFVIGLLVFGAIFAPIVTTADPLRIDLANSLVPPSSEHWLGTDVQGRDVWTRLIYGARVSLLVGLVSQGIALGIGVALGLLSGFYGKWTDEV
ncbi:MAG: ABC transporter permease, partial [Gemmatimonadaceae bacterium]